MFKYSVKDCFRKYDSPAECFTDHAQFFPAQSPLRRGAAGDGEIRTDLRTPAPAMQRRWNTPSSSRLYHLYAESISSRRTYWNRWRADEIRDQKLANILVDWVWGSGAWGIKIPQQLLGVTADGQVGAKAIAALNARDAEQFHAEIFPRRDLILHGIVEKDPSQKRFINGWLNRLDEFL